MQVKVDILEGLQRKLTVEVPAEKVDGQVLARLKKVQKTAKMDGFRKGKVPMKVVQSKYLAAVRQEVLGDVIESTYGEAIKSKGLTPASQPQITPISGFTGNEPFVYEAILEVVPEFEVKGLDSLTIKKPVAKVLAKDVKAMIDTLRKQLATYENTDDKAGEGDKATIEFIGKIDGKEFDGGKAKDIPVILGAKQMLPEFEEALFDKKINDETTAEVTFPEDYQVKDLAGKKATFEIKITKVEKQKLPRVDEKFIKNFGIDAGTKEELEKAIRENMERELEAGVRRSINQQVMQQLVDANPVVIPEGMVNQEKERMAKEANLEQQFPDEEERNKIKEEQFDQPARRRVLLGLVMGKLFEVQNITPDP